MKLHNGPDPFEVPDNGRRGAPIPGCDCMQCFGRCMIDSELRYREGLRRSAEAARAGRDERSGVPV